MNRIECLRSLVQFDGQLEEIISRLNKFAWDSEELVVLERKHILSVLQRLLNKTLSTEDVSEWADQIHVRDDIGLENKDRDLLREVLHELANPYLTRALSEDTAKEWIARLKSNAVRRTP